MAERTHPTRAAVALTVALILAPAARAQDTCEPYDAAAFAAAVEAVQAQLAAVELDAAGAALAAIHDRLPCLGTPAPRDTLALYARSRATAAFFGQDEELALRWSRAAKFTWDGGPWPALIGEEHPVTLLTEDMGPPLWGGPEDKQLAAGRDGAVFANGVFLARPRLAAEVPFLVQVFDRRGGRVRAYWQDGAAFPEDLLEPGAAALEAPSWFTPPEGAPEPGLGEAETFQIPVVTPDPGEGDDPVDLVPDVPPPPVDDRPIEVRAMEAWERAIGVADLNPDLGRAKLEEFLAQFGESGLPEVADARQWLADHPVPVVIPEVTPELVPDTPPDPVRPPRERPPREGGGGSPALRTTSLIVGGAALAMYGGAWGARAAYDANPSDGGRAATNALTLGSGIAGVGAIGLFSTSFVLGGDR